MLTTIEEIKDRLVRSYSPEKIILFGSHARGDANRNSDIDILILKDTAKRPIERRIQAEKIQADRSVPLDIVVYTPQEIRYLFSIGSPFIEEVIETGSVIYMRKTEDGLLPHGKPSRADAGRVTKASKAFMKAVRKAM